MNISRKSITAAAVSLAVLMGASSAAFAKGHDMGVADGDPADSTRDVVNSIEGPGISATTSKGARGSAASDARGGNAVDPGANDNRGR